MAKADDIHALSRAALNRDADAIRASIERLCANKPENSSLRRRLRRLLDEKGPSARMVALGAASSKLTRHEAPTHRLQDVVLPASAQSCVRQILLEHRFATALRGHNLLARSRLLLTGPPGTGKTVLAGAMADALQLPFLVVEYGRLISSNFGGTGANISRLVDDLMGTRCVLFIDEMETLLSERAGRDNTQEIGEQARVVSSLLLALDRLHRDGHVLVVGATNHPGMLDRAVRRRFDAEIELPLAGPQAVERLVKRLHHHHPDLDMGQFAPDSVDGLSLADVEREILERARAWVVARFADPETVALFPEEA